MHPLSPDGYQYAQRLYPFQLPSGITLDMAQAMYEARYAIGEGFSLQQLYLYLHKRGFSVKSTETGSHATAIKRSGEDILVMSHGQTIDRQTQQASFSALFATLFRNYGNEYEIQLITGIAPTLYSDAAINPNPIVAARIRFDEESQQYCFASSDHPVFTADALADLSGISVEILLHDTLLKHQLEQEFAASLLRLSGEDYPLPLEDHFAHLFYEPATSYLIQPLHSIGNGTYELFDPKVGQEEDEYDVAAQPTMYLKRAARRSTKK